MITVRGYFDGILGKLCTGIINTGNVLQMVTALGIHAGIRVHLVAENYICRCDRFSVGPHGIVI